MLLTCRGAGRGQLTRNCWLPSARTPQLGMYLRAGSLVNASLMPAQWETGKSSTKVQEHCLQRPNTFASPAGHMPVLCWLSSEYWRNQRHVLHYGKANRLVNQKRHNETNPPTCTHFRACLTRLLPQHTGWQKIHPPSSHFHAPLLPGCDPVLEKRLSRICLALRPEVFALFL